MMTDSMVCAGIDVSKAKLDIAIDPGGAHIVVSYDAAGLIEMDVFLRAHGVSRVGFESSGGYEVRLLRHLREGTIPASRFLASQTAAFARSRLNRTKNDKRDALMIAAFTASLKELPPLPDAKQDGLGEHLTYIEQLEDQLVHLKTMLESTREPRLASLHKRDIARLEARRMAEIDLLATAVRRQDEGVRTLALLVSIKGIGLRSALAIAVRMPEIGSLDRGEAAALAGLAPYDRDSGTSRGRRHVAGGRARLRKSLFMAAFSASQWNPDIRSFVQRLKQTGKHHTCAIVAAARKLIVLANAIVARGTPWTPSINPI